VLAEQGVDLGVGELEVLGGAQHLAQLLAAEPASAAVVE
jgi:hypothetical protein